MIRIENLTKRWENFSLDGISLDIRKGEYFVILGPTGSGKTLLLETLAGFHYPQGGRILFDGKDVTYLPPEKRMIGFVYQGYLLFPHKNVRENIAFGLKVKGMRKEAIEKRVRDLCELLRIEQLLSRDVLQLSRGEQQRVA